MLLKIRYRSFDDEVTERVISDAIVEVPFSIRAYCHLRQEERTFKISRIEEAIDVSTGEVISDICAHFGLPSVKTPPLELPTFPEVFTQLSTEDAKLQRNSDKRSLWGRFKIEAVIQERKRALHAIFANRCFKCGRSSRLVLDHHVPQVLGGRLVPGNIVLLCAGCNSRKHEKHPRDFYSEQQMALLIPMLEQQLALFNFDFDWNRWNIHPREYLVSLGVPEQEASTIVEELQQSRERSHIIRVSARISHEGVTVSYEQPNNSLQRP